MVRIETLLKASNESTFLLSVVYQGLHIHAEKQIHCNSFGDNLIENSN